MHVRMHLHYHGMYVFTRTCIYTHVCICYILYIHTYIYINTCIHTYIHTLAHTHTHTHTYYTGLLELNGIQSTSNAKYGGTPLGGFADTEIDTDTDTDADR